MVRHSGSLMTPQLEGRAQLPGDPAHRAESLAARTRRLLAEFGLRPRSALGQSFLVDERAAERIVEAALAGAPARVVEIGGGLGALTLPLARAGVDLTVYEIDRGLVQALAGLVGGFEKVRVCAEDALEVQFHGGTDAVAVGNLPYYITSPLLERLYAARPPFRSLVVTVQREVGERMQAVPGTGAYGPLTLWTRFHATAVERIAVLPPGAFWPRPKVSSLALRLILRGGPPEGVMSERGFFAAVRAGLGHRRKTLLNSLRHDPRLGQGDDRARDVLIAAGLDGQRRGETLEFAEFVALGNALERAIPPAAWEER